MRDDDTRSAVPPEDVHAFGDLAAAADAFEHLPFMAVVTEGPDLRLQAFNAAARAITQDRMVQGEPLMEAFPRELTGQGWQEAVAAPTSTGETVVTTGLRVQIHQPDGDVLEVYLDSVYAPRPGPDGTPRGTLLTIQDATQRVRDRQAAERELEELRERYAAAQGSVRAMQRALLADSVPVLPSFDVAACYVLASDEQAAGGDWFDAVVQDDGALVLVVGDVVGHGQAAAVAMGQLRSVLLSQLRAGVGTTEALRFTDTFAASVPAAARATVCVVRLDEDGALEYCTAGHPPPLVVGEALLGKGEGARYLPPTGTGPLVTGADFRTTTDRLRLGEAVVLYSDGILERPGINPAAGSAELLAAADGALRNELMPVGAPASGPERVCTLSIELLTRRTGHTDDITVLVAQRRQRVEGMVVDTVAASGATREVRDALRRWLATVGVGAGPAGVLLTTATELVQNVVDHAYLDEADRPLRVVAELDTNGAVVVDVTDRGRWQLPLITGGRGRGLTLVRALADELHLERATFGTTARVRHRGGRPAGLLERPVTRPQTDPEHFDVLPNGGPEPVVHLIGPLDADHVDEAASFLGLALTEALSLVTVDLTHLTLLASSGVDLLFRLLAQARELDLQLDVVAPNGSPAQHVLSLVQLPHRHAARAL